MTPEYSFTAQFARGTCSGTIMRESDGLEIDLRGDDVVRLIDELAGSSSKVDTLRNWFLSHWNTHPTSMARPARSSGGLSTGDWQL